MEDPFHPLLNVVHSFLICREKELNAIKINDSDLKVIQEQFDYSRKEAERVLREAGGDLKTCLKTLMEA